MNFYNNWKQEGHNGPGVTHLSLLDYVKKSNKQQEFESKTLGYKHGYFYDFPEKNFEVFLFSFSVPICNPWGRASFDPGDII